VAADHLSPTVSDTEETNDRRGTKRDFREEPTKFPRGKYEKIKEEYQEDTGGTSMSKKLAKMRDFK
jgi:hypothetical protein